MPNTWLVLIYDSIEESGIDMVAHPKKSKFFESLGKELDSQASRVRELIGDAHWGHDGRHKEILLQDLVRRYCPSSTLVSTGFIVSPNDGKVLSREQDVLVIDTTREAPLFYQGDLAIVFPHTVIAAISVKTSLSVRSLNSVMDGLTSVRKVERDCNFKQFRIWCAGFFFSADDPWATDPKKVSSAMQSHFDGMMLQKTVLDTGFPGKRGPDMIVDARSRAYILDYEGSHVSTKVQVRGYECDGLATAVFISCLVEHMGEHLGNGRSMFADFISDPRIKATEPLEFELS